MTHRRRTPVLACASLAALAASARAEIVYETYADPASFARRLGGEVRVVGFDDVDVGAADSVAFDARRYAGQGLVVTAAGAGGQFASRNFANAKNFRASSRPNLYAPGPEDGNGTTTTATFEEDGESAVVAGFGCFFVDADFPAIGPSSFDVRDVSGTVLATTGTVSGKNRSRLFRGIVAVDSESGRPIPVIASARIVSGQGWPGVRAFEGVALDDFSFGVPVAQRAAGRFRFARTGLVRNEARTGSFDATIHRLGGTAGAVSVTVDAAGAVVGSLVDPLGVSVQFADGQSVAKVTLNVHDDLLPLGDQRVVLSLVNPTGDAGLLPGVGAFLHLLDDEGCPAGDSTGDGLLDVPVLDAKARQVRLVQAPTRAEFALGAPLAAGTLPAAVFPAHLGGLSLRDAVVVDAKAFTLRIHLDPGTPTPPEPLVASLGGKPSATCAADLDEDGLDEIVVALPGGVRIVEVDGGGTADSSQLVPGTRGGAAIAVGELDGDGPVEIAVADRRGAVTILDRRPDMTWGVASTQPAPKRIVAMAAADVDDDDDLDLVVATPKEVRVLRGDGRGTFADGGESIRPGGTPGAVAFGRVDGDARIDLVVALPSRRGFAVVRGAPGGVFGAPTFVAGNFAPSALYVVDADGDAKPDVVAAHLGGHVEVSLGDGAGGFSAPFTPQ